MNVITKELIAALQRKIGRVKVTEENAKEFVHDLDELKVMIRDQYKSARGGRHANG